MIGSSFRYAEHEQVPAYDDAERWVNADGDLEVKLYRNGNMVLHLAEVEREEIEAGLFYVSAFAPPRKGRQTREDKLNGTTIYDVHERNDGNGNAVYTEYSENTEKFDGRELQNRTMHNVQHLDNDVERDALLPMEVAYNVRKNR